MKEVLLICISILATCAFLLIYGRVVGIPSGEEIVSIPQFIMVVVSFMIPTSAGYLIGRFFK